MKKEKNVVEQKKKKKEKEVYIKIITKIIHMSSGATVIMSGLKWVGKRIGR